MGAGRLKELSILQLSSTICFTSLFSCLVPVACRPLTVIIKAFVALVLLEGNESGNREEENKRDWRLTLHGVAA